MLSARMNEGGDPAHPATTMGDSAKTQLDYIAEDVIKRFSRSKTADRSACRRGFYRSCLSSLS